MHNVISGDVNASLQPPTSLAVTSTGIAWCAFVIFVTSHHHGEAKGRLAGLQLVRYKCGVFAKVFAMELSSG